MNFSLMDTGGFLAAVLACGFVLVAPGYALARLSRVSHNAGPPDLLTGVVIGLATLPAIDSIAVRFCGLGVALSISLVLAAAGAGFALRDHALVRPSQLGLALIGGWLVLLMIEWVDLDIAGKLYQPLTIFDAVKHAATTQAIYDSGAPPRDAFFLRPERSSYYYFFYTPAALVMRLCLGLVDAKAAVGGLVFWTGLGAFGLVRLTLARIGFDQAIGRRPLLITAVMAAGGLDIMAVLYFAWTRSYWMADPLQWNDVQVGQWFEDILWVPHHVAALIAGTVGLVALTDIAGDGKALVQRSAAASVILAGLCFAASFGLSIWVTLGFVVTVAVWGLVLLVERRWRAAACLTLAGMIALLLTIPQLIDLKAGRAGGGPVPIALAVRSFLPIHLYVPDGPWQVLGDFVCLPINYGIEFGVLILGSIAYWRQRRREPTSDSEFGRVLTIAALSGLLVGAFLRSTLFNNDLGWRVLLLPLLAGTAWTIIALHRRGEPLRAVPWTVRPAIYAFMAVGWMTVLYTAISMRAYPFITVNHSARFIAGDPATERGLRVAYGWVTANLSQAAVLQQNPIPRRAFAFGVYGRNPVGVADAFGSLYGADPQAVSARINALGPIFETDLPASEVRRRAAAAGIDDLVVTAADPVWSQPDAFVWREKPIFASPRVRIIPVVTLDATR